MTAVPSADFGKEVVAELGRADRFVNVGAIRLLCADG
jgi:hypothetical protein